MGKIENGIYYDSEGKPYHKGVVEVDGKIYYAGENGEILKNCEKTIHHGMGNGLVPHGRYYFNAEGVCELDSFSKVVDEEKPKKKKKEKKKLMKSQKILISVGCACLLAFVALIATKVVTDTIKKAKEDESKLLVEEVKPIELTLPEFSEEVYLCSDTMKKYYNGEMTLSEVVDTGASAYSPFVFEYKIRNAKTATLIISENSNYSDSLEFDLDVYGSNVSVDNLKTNTTYYYLVTAINEQGTKKIDGGKFKTADTNRFVSLTGVYNSRDIGGYDTIFGKKVKQGLLIRGTELDGLVEGNCYLYDETQTEPFGFVYDFDLRGGASFNTEYVSRLGVNVGHKFYNSPAYSNIFISGNETIIKQIFTDLADKNNYPMYMHSTYGADRTGTIVFLLQGLLGVSEEDMMTEYELTCFIGSAYATGYKINSVYSGLQSLEGDTINEKIEKYMTDVVGLTNEQIQSIRDIFLE